MVIRHVIMEIIHQPNSYWKYGFRMRFEDSDRYHIAMDTFDSERRALNWCDGDWERIWIDPPPGSDLNVIRYSREYREGTHGWRMERWQPAGRSKRR